MEIKKIVLLIGISIVSQFAVAQCRLTATLSTSGNCRGSIDVGVERAVAEGFVKHYNGKTFTNGNECNNARIELLSLSGSVGGCTIRISASCNGCEASSGAVDVLGVDKGTSFYSVNGVNEINDWSNDDMERMLALNPNHSSIEPERIVTGDPDLNSFIDNMPYSDEAFSGRMPKGSTQYIYKPDEKLTAIRPPSKNLGIMVPDDFTSKPLNTGLGEWHSDDLKPVNIELKPVPSDTGFKDEEGVVHKAFRTIDEKMDWYIAEDGNVFQYIYTKSKQNVQDISEWWTESNISSRISNTLGILKDVIKDDASSAGVKLLFKPEYQNTVENAFDIQSTLSGSITQVFEQLDAKTIVNKASRGENMDLSPIERKIQDDVNRLAIRISGIPNPESDLWDNYRHQIEKKAIDKIDIFKFFRE